MVQTKTKTIDGAEYSTTTFPGRRALSLQRRLIKAVGPAFAEAFAGMLFKGGSSPGGASLQDLEIDPAHIQKAVGLLADSLSEETDQLILDLLSSTRKGGKELTSEVIDLEFSGKLMTIYKVLFFVIQVNGFFGEGGIGMLTGMMPPQAETPTETTSKST